MSADILREAARELRNAPADMRPEVARALADLLENACCGLYCDADGLREPFCWDCEDSTFDHECPAHRPCKHTVDYRDALAVARAILGRLP